MHLLATLFYKMHFRAITLSNYRKPKPKHTTHQGRTPLPLYLQNSPLRHCRQATAWGRNPLPLHRPECACAVCNRITKHTRRGEHPAVFGDVEQSAYLSGARVFVSGVRRRIIQKSPSIGSIASICQRTSPGTVTFYSGPLLV